VTGASGASGDAGDGPVSPLPVDLDNCADEPIHIPGSIQPRGALFAVSEPGLIVTRVSSNLGEIVGLTASDAPGRPLVELIGSPAADNIIHALATFGDLRERNPLDVVVDVQGVPVEFDAILHRNPAGVLIVELEPAKGPRPFSFPNTYQAVRGAVSDLNRTVSVDELYRIAARAVRQLTGFDRVMVYRYDHEFNGGVVAEDRRLDLESFLGLHYPASDIPVQARDLYEKNWIRLISDVDYRPAPIYPSLDPDTQDPLDLTFATLRSVSPIHIEYLQNMGVRASMSISLLRDGVLWGLIACHHYSGAHTPPFGVRAAAEFLGSTLSLRLVDQVKEDELRSALASQSVLASLTRSILDESRTLAEVLHSPSGLPALIPTDGLALSVEGVVASSGAVPDVDTVRRLAAWAASSGEERLVTDSLTASLPWLSPSSEFCGLLALSLPEDQYILLFRSEARQAIDWGGNPNAKQGTPDQPARLSPRKSFERWQEEVKLRSNPWTTHEVGLASAVRSRVVETLYVRSGRELRLAESLQRSLLPATLPSVQGWTITAHYEPAEGGRIGGDWYDVVSLAEGMIAIVLGDVAGHGMPAAGTMAQLRNALRAYLLLTESPGMALANLNEFASLLLPGVFATAVVACVHTPTGRVSAASAGHLTPLLVAPGRRGSAVPMRTSMPLGVAEAKYVVSEFTIPAGHGLILFSDGLVERRGEDITVGLGRLASGLSSLGPELTAADIARLVGTTGTHDDTTVVSLYRGDSDRAD
jgi:chemotaxis family two-component system sensor kinase Cph1